MKGQAMRTAIVITALLSLLTVSVIFALKLWFALTGVELSGHGWAAMGLGIVLTMVLGVGLMRLSFYSERSGKDDEAAEWDLSQDPGANPWARRDF